MFHAKKDVFHSPIIYSATQLRNQTLREDLLIGKQFEPAVS